MSTPRISASSYSNTAPLIWSYIYGRGHGAVELILDNAPARSAELLAGGRVDAALVPVFAYQMLGNVRIVPGVCVGARQRVRSVCLVTRGTPLSQVRRVALDASSRTSVALVKLVFREFLDREPEWTSAEPSIDDMLLSADAALIIGDPALALDGDFEVHDLADLWHRSTGLGFIFAMWMTRHERPPVDLAGARDEGLENLEAIAANYAPRLGLSAADMSGYLSETIAYTPDDAMLRGMDLFFDLCARHKLIDERKPLVYTQN